MIDLSNLEGFDSFEAIQKELERRMKAHNDRVIDDFDGLSPNQMSALRHNFPNSKSPLTLNTLPEKELEQCPLLMQVRFLIDKMRGGETIRLTKTGALNTKIVKELYGLGYFKEKWIEEGIQKLYKESDAPSVQITRILLEISSLAKKRHDKLSLTKKGEELADDGNAILKELILMLFYKLNWPYFDFYDSPDIGKLNPAFSLYLIKKYGDVKRNADFYANLYFKAFPMLLTEGKESYRCYKHRIFDLYFNYFGLIKLDKESFSDPLMVQKTPFFDSLISYTK